MYYMLLSCIILCYIKTYDMILQKKPKAPVQTPPSGQPTHPLACSKTVMPSFWEPFQEHDRTQVHTIRSKQGTLTLRIINSLARKETSTCEGLHSTLAALFSC